MPLCEVSVLEQSGLHVITHLESRPNVPKPSCDEAVIDEHNQPFTDKLIYVPAGDVVKIHCGRNSGKRLVVNTDDPRHYSHCYGGFLDLVCHKISEHNAEWRVLSEPSNSQLPVCIDECRDNRFVAQKRMVGSETCVMTFFLV